MLNTVDPIGRGELSYLAIEFYNFCYSSTAISLEALILNYYHGSYCQYLQVVVETDLE